MSTSQHPSSLWSLVSKAAFWSLESFLFFFKNAERKLDFSTSSSLGLFSVYDWLPANFVNTHFVIPGFKISAQFNLLLKKSFHTPSQENVCMFCCCFAGSWGCHLFKTFVVPLKRKNWRPLLYICIVLAFHWPYLPWFGRGFWWKLVRSFIHVVNIQIWEITYNYTNLCSTKGKTERS